MTWHVDLSRRTQRMLDRASLRDRRRLLDAIRNLAEDPFAGDILKLHGVADAWRLRVGPWRIFIRIDQSERKVGVEDIVRRTSTTY